MSVVKDILLPPLFATPENKKAPKLFVINEFGAFIEVPGGH